LTLFSVGADGAPAPDGAVVVVAAVVVVVVVVSGAFSSLAQAAVIAPMTMIADMPATAAMRRGKRCESIVQSYPLFR
jgi:Na+/melibiose symporter-like transporter